MNPGLTLDQVLQLETQGAISPQTADILKAQLAGENPAGAPRPLEIPPPDFSKLEGGSGDFGAGLTPQSVTGPASVPPELLARTPAPMTLPNAPGIDPSIGAPLPPPLPSPVPTPTPTPPPSPTAAPATISGAPATPTPSATPAARMMTQEPDGNDLIQKGFDEQRAALGEAALSAAQAETGVLHESIKQAQALEDARKEEERFQLEKKKRLDDGQALYQQSLSDLNSQKIDPNRLYANTSTGDKILAGIGIALGGIASGMSGKPNAAMKVIQDAIDRDIDAQKIEIEKKVRAVGAQGSLYNDLVGRLQNEDAARHYLTSLMLEQSKNTLDQYKTQISTSSQRAELAKLYGEIDVRSGEAQLKAKEALEKDPGIQQGIRAGVKTGQIDEANLSKEDRERYVKGLGFAKDKQAADDLTEAQSAQQEGIKLIDEIINAREKGEEGGKGAEVMSAAFISNQQRRAASLLIKFKDIAKLGALNESDYAVLYKMVPKDPTAFTRANIPIIGGAFEDPIVAQLKGLKDEFTNKYKNKIKTLIEPTQGATNVSTDLNLTPR